MARIRTIKPEYWQDEKLAPLRPIDRLVFLGLISQADDRGRLIDNPRMLDGLLFPETDDTCEESLEILARLARIIRYTSKSGQRLLQIAKWEDHQRVDKPSKHNLPAPSESDLKALAAQRDAESSRDPREILATVSGDALAPILDRGPTTMDLGPSTVDREQVVAASPDEPAPAPAPAEPASSTDWKAELRTACAELAGRWCDTDRERRSFEAATESLIDGSIGRSPWRNPHTGERIPEADRPDLYRQAALRHFEKPTFSLDQSLTYVLKATLDPSNDPEAKKRSETATDRRMAEERKRDAQVEADQLAMKRWEQTHPEEAERIREEAEAAVEVQGIGRSMMVKAEISRRIRQAMEDEGGQRAS